MDFHENWSQSAILLHFTDGTDQDTGYEDLQSVISKQPNLFAAIMSRRKVGVWLLCTGGSTLSWFLPFSPRHGSHHHYHNVDDVKP